MAPNSPPILSLLFPADQHPALIGEWLRPHFDWFQHAAGETCSDWYDTFDFALFHADHALSRVGSRLKLLPLEHGWPGAPLLISAPLPDPIPPLAWQQPDPLFRAELQPLTGIRAITCLARTRLWEQLAELRNADGKTVLRLQLFAIWSTNSETPLLRFLRLRPLRGYAPEADGVREILLSHGLTPMEEPPFAALLRASGEPVRHYTLQPPLALEPETVARTAAIMIVHTMLDIARLNEPGILQDRDTEFLHDYRVSLRKIRSVLGLFRGVFPEPVTTELKSHFAALARRTNRLRDLDVYLLDREPLTARLPERLQSGLEKMFADFSEERTTCHVEVCKALRSDETGSVLERIGRLLETKEPAAEAGTPVRALLARQIWRRYRKIRRLSRALLATSPADEFHAVRIEAKKLRYLLEFSRNLFAPALLDDLTRRLRKLQNRLGLFNDTEVQQAALFDYMETCPTVDSGLAMSVGALVGVLHQCGAEERPKIVRTLHAFCAGPVARRFRDAFRPSEPAPTAQPPTS